MAACINLNGKKKTWNATVNYSCIIIKARHKSVTLSESIRTTHDFNSIILTNGTLSRLYCHESTDLFVY